MPIHCILLLSLAVATQVRSTPVDIPSEARATIAGNNAAWIAAMKREDTAVLVAPYADNALFVASNGFVVHGRAAIGTFMRRGFVGTGRVVGGAVVQDGLAMAGDLIYEWGRANLELEPQKGQRRQATGRYLTVWQEIDGQWQIVRSLSFPGAPPTTPAARVP